MAEVKQIDKAVRVTFGDNSRYYMSKSEALQLAKDLLEACNVPKIQLQPGDMLMGTGGSKHPASCPCNKCLSELLEEIANAENKSDVSSGLSLDEIQIKASNIHRNYPLWDGGQELARLIANLAARMKEISDQAERNRLVTYSNLRRIAKLEREALGIKEQ